MPFDNTEPQEPEPEPGRRITEPQREGGLPVMTQELGSSGAPSFFETGWTAQRATHQGNNSR